jgi:hypothetical protein
MLPWHRGGTMANLGLAWGWRVISPRWRGLWDNADPTTLPLDYDEELMDKAVVLLTDGVNQWYDWPDGLPGSPMNGTYPGADYTSYGRINEERLGPGINTNSEAKAEVNARMARLCTAMKAEDIIIYTITFQENDAATQNLFRNCATSPEHYYNSPTNEDLAVAFNAIGTELSNLRLSE